MTARQASPSVTGAPDNVVRVSKLVRAFGPVPVLDHLDLEIERGSFVALLGRSGSGKSTLLRTLAGLDAAPAGSVIVPARRAVVFQEPRLVPWRKVWRNLTLGLRQDNPRAVALAALAEVGLSHRADAWPLTLSGGEAQRAALARALIRKPELLLLDEPFAALDALTRILMQRLVVHLWDVHRPTILLVTHDVDEALQLADRVIVLDRGRIASDHNIDLPRPRARTAPQVDALRTTLLSRLGVESETGPSSGAAAAQSQQSPINAYEVTS